MIARRRTFAMWSSLLASLLVLATVGIYIYWQLGPRRCPEDACVHQGYGWLLLASAATTALLVAIFAWVRYFSLRRTSG